MRIFTNISLTVILTLFYLTSLQAQSNLSGTVIDATTNDPLIGVSILVEETSLGTFTDIDGRFIIESEEDLSGKNLIFSYIGFNNQTIAITNPIQSFDVLLQTDATGLEEVLVIGSSITQSRKKLGNAVTSIKSAEILKASPINITSSIQGRVPGAQITQNSGDPAGGFSIRLRGPSTIQGSSEPLYIVDGVVTSNLTTNVTNLNVPAGDAAPGQNRMVDINPNDIDNINILNGAAAAAIYGSRASNGVVIITTRKGSELEKPEFYFKTTFNMNQIRKKLDLNLEGQEFETVPSGALAGRLWPIFGFNPETNAATPFLYLSADKFSTTRYDYQDDIFHTGLGTDNYLSVRGGSKKFKYSGSLGYLTNQGIVRNTQYNRFSARFNATHTVTDWLSYDLGIYVANSASDEKPDGNVFWSPINAMNITNNTFDLSRRDASGNLLAVESTRVNPMSIIETFDITQRVNHVIPSLQVQLKPFKNLRIDQILGVDTYDQQGDIFIPIYPYAGVNPAYFNDGYKGSATANVFNWNYDINAEYNWDINTNINSKTTAGYSFQASKLEFDGEQGRGLNNNNQPTIELQTLPIDSRLDIYGFYLQETFSFYDRFYLTLAGRIDGATNFDVDNRSNFYPKISGSYVLQKYSEGAGKILNSARVRASYGEAGNLTAISPFERFGRYTPTEFLGSSPLQQNNRLGNENLVPERTKEFEIGGDFNFFNNRLSMLVTYYNQNIEDLIVSRVLAPSIGGASRTENVGTMKNEGLEMYANIQAIRKADLSWDFNLNFSRNRNEVVKTIGGDINVANVAGAAPIVREGEPLGVFYGTYFARNADGSEILVAQPGEGTPANVPQPERGDAATGLPQRDANGQPTGDLLRTIIGDPNPDFILGFGTSLRYKNFDFAMQWESVQGFDVFDADKRTRQGVGLGRLARQELLGELPRGYIAAIYPIEEFRVEDGSFTKLREVSLSYTFSSVANDALKNVRVSIIGRNLLSIDNFFSFDPETNAGGQSNLLRAVNFGNVPIPRTFAISLSTNF